MERKNPLETLMEKYVKLDRALDNNEDIKEIAQEITRYRKGTEFEFYKQGLDNLYIKISGQTDYFKDSYNETMILLRAVQTRINPISTRDPKMREQLKEKLPRLISRLEIMNDEKSTIERAIMGKEMIKIEDKKKKSYDLSNYQPKFI